MDDPKSPTRADLARFITDQRTLRAFEQLFKLVPSEINNTNAEVLRALNQSRQALDLAGFAIMQAGESAIDDGSQIGPPGGQNAAPSTPIVSGVFVATLPSGSGVFEHFQTIAAPGVTAGMEVQIQPASHANTDENDVSMLSIESMGADAGAGSISVTLAFSELTAGPIRLSYIAV